MENVQKFKQLYADKKLEFKIDSKDIFRVFNDCNGQGIASKAQGIAPNVQGIAPNAKGWPLMTRG